MISPKRVIQSAIAFLIIAPLLRFAEAGDVNLEDEL